jgi:transcriptional regulator with XRE-family HTH domain
MAARRAEDHDPDVPRSASASADLRAIGARLKRVREAAGWTQELLAEAIDVTPHTVSQYERGEQAPRLTTLLRIAAALRVRPGDIIDVALAAPVASPPPDGAEVLGLYRSLSDGDRDLVVRLVRDVAASKR